jgi:hypothetical protein
MKDALGDFQAIIEKLVSLFSALGALTAILVVLPVSLWFAWARHSAVAYALVQTLFCAVFGWGVVSAFKLQRGLLKLSPSDRPRVLSGPRPDDAVELYVWKWAWQFMYEVIAVALSMLAIPLTAAFTGR